MFYFKLHNPDWALSTQHLSPLEEGIYLRLIRHYYDTEKSIPLETGPVIRRLRLAEYDDIANALLEEFFERTEKGWRNNRCEKEIKAYKKKAKANRVNGKSGGRPKKIKDLGASKANTEKKPTGIPPESEKEDNGTLTKNHKPLTTNQEPLKTPAEAVFDYWQQVTGKKRSKFNTTIRGKINTRLKTFTIEQLKQAIDGNSKSPFHQGQNDNNKIYNSLELICRNDEKTQGFIDTALQLASGGANNGTNQRSTSPSQARSARGSQAVEDAFGSDTGAPPADEASLQEISELQLDGAGCGTD